MPCVLRASPLNTPDAEAFDSAMVPGAPLCDAPLQTPQGDPAWLLRSLGPGFTLLVFGDAPHWVRELPGVAVRCLGQDLIDAQGVLARRLDGQPGTAYLVRPDQHVCARWRQPSLEAVRAALRLANGLRD